jgi:hypothetical protein
VAYKFQTGNNKIKLLAEYESVTQNVLLAVESILHNAKQLQHAQFYLIVFGLKIMGHGNPDNNLESLYIYLWCGFELITTVTVQNTIFWDVTPCGLVFHRHFGRIFCLHLQGRRKQPG